MTDGFLEFALAVRTVEDWGWCGVAASEVGLVGATLAHTREAACVTALQQTSSAASARARGAARLRRRRAEHDQWPPAGRAAYQTAGHGLEQLWEYLTAGRQRLEVALDHRAGTDFQRRTWDAIRQVPFGETRSYAWLARAVGSPHATRAIGRAVGSSPNLIFVPCHRIVASRGLGGYARGLSVKRQLLDHEESWPRMRPMLGP